MPSRNSGDRNRGLRGPRLAGSLRALRNGCFVVEEDGGDDGAAGNGGGADVEPELVPQKVSVTGGEGRPCGDDTGRGGRVGGVENLIPAVRGTGGRWQFGVPDGRGADTVADADAPAGVGECLAATGGEE